MAGDLEQKIQRASRMSSLADGYARARERYDQTMQKSIDRRDQRKIEAEEAARQAALEQRKIDAQLAKDKKQQQYEQANTYQRAQYAADAANAAAANTSKLNAQQQKGTLKRDALQDRYQTARDRQQAFEQQQRDVRQFGFSQLDNAQQFQNQLQRDSLQQGYTNERDAIQQGYTNQRDYMQFGYDTLRGDQQQRDMLSRDQMQQMQQMQRDQQLNEYAVQQDSRQQTNLLEREKQQQGFTQQNLYQREAADISAKWQEQIAQAKNAGLDFSEAQKKELAQLDKTFRQKVVNGAYSDAVKQRAMVEHQKRLAQIVPEETVRNPQEIMNSSIMFHEPTRTWFRQGQDSRGMPTFEPMEIGDASAQRAGQQVASRQEDAARKASFERADAYDKLVDQLQLQINPATEELIYDTPEKLEAEAMRRFAVKESLYRQQYGLAPFPPFQREADRISKAADQAMPQQLRPQGGGVAGQPITNKWKTMLNSPQQPMMKPPAEAAPPQTPPQELTPQQKAKYDSLMSRMPPVEAAPPQTTKKAQAKNKPVELMAATIDSTIEEASKRNDVEVAAALTLLKSAAEKAKKEPQAGTGDLEAVAEAIRFLRGKGIDLQAKAKDYNDTLAERYAEDE